MADIRGESGSAAPRVDELFQQAVAAQLAVQQAQRDSYTEFAQRLEVAERLMTDGLGAIVKVLGANDTAIEHLVDRVHRMEERLADANPHAASTAADALGVRIDALEAAVLERVGALDTSRRIDALEAQVLERLERLGAQNPSHAVENVLQRMSILEETIKDSLGTKDMGGVDSLDRRMAILEQTVNERLGALRDAVAGGLDQLSTAFASAGGRYEEALEDAKASREAMRSRLSELEGSVRKFEEQTSEQLAELREASTAAEAGILERIILESQTVASHFETVRPAVEAAVQAAPELETTLTELRELAERAMSLEEPADSGPYSAEELLAPHEEEHEDDPLFQPPEETKIPDRRLFRRDR